MTASECPGFVVDGGFGALLDAAALPFSRRLQDEIVRASDSGAGIPVFGCGIGDGLYPSWIGHDSCGRIGCLAIDLDLLSRAEAAEQ